MKERGIYTSDDVLNMLVERSAILKGHFVLSSGLHSDTYIQCAKLQEAPSVCETLCAALLRRSNDVLGDLKIDVVASPAMGAIVFGYEIARQLGVNFVFFERVQGNFELRRGFCINANSRVLIVEDVITTGGSSLEVFDAVTALGGKVMAELSIISRGSCVNMPFPVVSLLEMDIRNYAADDIPDELKSIPVSKPGSRSLS
ncbi:orotate phosphoribosyltransferase [Anaplasma marginale]|uniref:Orotate phosphoribosyltransferase n=1 Tax=Anaplasma marginale TaxID=770 RepID=A0A643CJT2_ANAMA|nr:orotate phosphoribosyltransferase [Anaplasma marginale]AGZ78537.1 orotate phosphoribosyltransferase [Anaplasma marginale str. Gypsy Plains]AXW83735.1 orotate phosphoribosyltransferase [Anaplasma marginale]AXW84653.1 orotate phosphoribosyltransferase [Anaplasma marginale]KAA8473496.1 orotate phosphoribosyltransferase [Anaplasma marginale]KAB0450665.1 orotate phosphoribosyltransferase [Anaplasma marginale]